MKRSDYKKYYNIEAATISILNNLKRHNVYVEEGTIDGLKDAIIDYLWEKLQKEIIKEAKNLDEEEEIFGKVYDNSYEFSYLRIRSKMKIYTKEVSAATMGELIDLVESSLKE